MGISLVLVAIFFFGGFREGTEGTSLAEPVITNTILRWSYVLFIIAAFFALVFPLYLLPGTLRVQKGLEL